LARAYLASNAPFNHSNLFDVDPNKHESEKDKIDVKGELEIDENWTPRTGVYLLEESDDEDPKAIAAILHAVLHSGVIWAEAILNAGTKYALQLTLTHPLDMKLVNGFPGILVAAKTLQENSDLFQGKDLKVLDTCV
jgi:hypothetical protein